MISILRMIINLTIIAVGLYFFAVGQYDKAGAIFALVAAIEVSRRG